MDLIIIGLICVASAVLIRTAAVLSALRRAVSRNGDIINELTRRVDRVERRIYEPGEDGRVRT